MKTQRIAEKLKEIRGNKTQAEMAKMLNITVSAVGNYERGDRIPRDEVKLKYAAISGLSVEDIFFNSDDTFRV